MGQLCKKLLNKWLEKKKKDYEISESYITKKKKTITFFFVWTLECKIVSLKSFCIWIFDQKWNKILIFKGMCF